LSHYWSRSDALWPWQSKKGRKKKDSGKLAIRPDHPRRRIEVKVCMPGGLQCVVLSSFIEIGPVVSPLWVVENRPFPLLLPLAYNSLYYRTSRGDQTFTAILFTFYLNKKYDLLNSSKEVFRVTFKLLSYFITVL